MVFKKIETDKGRKWKLENNVPNVDASAEIASILAIIEDETDSPEVEVHLIATDTVLSVFAAELIVKWFQQNKSEIKVSFEREVELDKPNQHPYIIQNLSISSNEEYQEGFMNLIDVVTKLIQSSKKSNNEVIINITGGYKAIIPILTLVGQIEEVLLKYIYDENSQSNKVELVEVKNLPFNFDWKLGELYLDDLSGEGLKQIKSKINTLNYLRKLSLINNDYKLTPLGRLFTTRLRGQMDSKKSTLGYLVELKVFEYFIKKQKDTIRGRAFWWDKTNPSKFYDASQYEKDDKLEQRIDIDILLKHDNQETWNEVKSCSSSGLKKARKQLETMLNFINSTSYSRVNTIGLILYKLETTDLSFYERQINGIKKLFDNQNINFILHYINIPVSNKGTFNTKGFFEQDIELL